MASAKNDKGSFTPAEDFFLRQHTIAQKNLRAYLRKEEPESLHQFRVAIKKIKAVLGMLKKLEPRFDFDKGISSYQAIFKCAGPIREEFLQAEKNHRLNLTDQQTISKLNNDLLLASPMFFKNCKSTLAKNLKGLHGLKKDDIYQYCKKLSGKLKSNWKKADNEDKLHHFRKEVKQILYCSRLLEKKKKEKLLSTKKSKQLDELQDLIGHWHDNILLLQKIKHEGLKVKKSFVKALKKETKHLLKQVKYAGGKL